MTSHPRVSVIIPSYNRARWLPATVQSALAQTRPPFEIIIVDDGSTDDTADVCARLPVPVRYLRQPNGGVSAARNRALSEAQGDYVALLDSDDIWAPEKLEVQLALHEAHPEIGWSATSVNTIGPDDRILPGRGGFERVFALFDGMKESASTFFDRWLVPSTLTAAGRPYRIWTGDFYAPLFFGNFILPSSALLRREVFGRVGGFNEEFRLAEETEFFHRLAAASPGGLVADPLCRYRVGPGESLVSPANMVPLIENALKSGEMAFQLRRPMPAEAREAHRAGRCRLLVALAYTHLAIHDGRRARAAVRSAWAAGARAPRTLAIYLASLLPAALLSVMHGAKRRLQAETTRPTNG